MLGVHVVGVGAGEPLEPTRWMSFTEIACSFPGLFDATSGHLPVPLMLEIAAMLHDELCVEFARGHVNELEVPAGSGETFVCLKLAFPGIKMRPVYDLSPGTQYNEEAPLNLLVNMLKNG